MKTMDFATLTIGCALILGVAACTDAETASYNLSRAADMFEIERRVVFINGITNDQMLSIEGRCSIEADTMDKQLEVTCKTGPDAYKKHFLGVSDNVSYVVEQLDDADVNVYHHRIIYKPQGLLPDFDLRIDGSAVVDTFTN